MITPHIAHVQQGLEFFGIIQELELILAGSRPYNTEVL